MWDLGILIWISTHSHVSYIFRSVPESQQQVQSSVSALGHYWGLGPRGLIHHSCFCLVLWITAGLLFCTLCILSCLQGGGADDGRTSQGICGKTHCEPSNQGKSPWWHRSDTETLANTQCPSGCSQWHREQCQRGQSHSHSKTDICVPLVLFLLEKRLAWAKTVK